MQHGKNYNTRNADSNTVAYTKSYVNLFHLNLIYWQLQYM